jgi:hypothetical protein
MNKPHLKRTLNITNKGQLNENKQLIMKISAIRLINQFDPLVSRA